MKPLPNREAWLNAVAQRMAPWFEQLGHPLPPFRVSIGFTSKGSRSRRIGECWGDAASADGHHEIFIVPSLDDPLRIADILAHELVHAAVGVAEGHKGKFAKVAKAIGLEGKMTATVGGEMFKQAVGPILDAIGPLPHAKLGSGADYVTTGPKKQSTRLIKATCPECGYTVRVTRKWLDAVGAPICPADGAQMKEE